MLVASCFIPKSIFAAEKITSQDGKWQYYFSDDGKDTVLSKYLGNDIDVVVPASVDGHQITYTFSTFEKNNTIQRITFEEGLPEIGLYTFRNCQNLKEVNLPKSLKYINEYTLTKTPNLKEIVIPANVEYISRNAYDNLSNINIIYEGEPLKKVVPESEVSALSRRYIEVGVTVDYDKAYKMGESINKERAKKNLPAVTIDTGNDYGIVRAIESMLYFDHVTLGGDSSLWSLPHSNSENIAVHDTLNSSAETLHKALKNSKGHYENMVSPGRETVVVAYAMANGKPSVTTASQIFLTEKHNEVKKTGQEYKVLPVYFKSSFIPLTFQFKINGSFKNQSTLNVGNTITPELYVSTNKGSYGEGGCARQNKSIVATTSAWSTTDQNVATVDENGKIQAVGGGDCEIHCMCGSEPQTLTIHVNGPKKEPEIPKNLEIIDDVTSDTPETPETPKTAENPKPVEETIPTIKYRTHVQNVGWQNYVADGQMAGTSGQSLRLEGMNIKLENQNCSGDIEYRTHIQNIGWENQWKKNDEMSGTSGRSYRLEAMQIRLTGELAEKYDVYYRVHAQNIGWMSWAKNGEESGTAGHSYRLEGMQIVLVKKGENPPVADPASNTNMAYVQR